MLNDDDILKIDINTLNIDSEKIKCIPLHKTIDSGITTYGNLAFLIIDRLRTIEGVALSSDDEKKFHISKFRNNEYLYVSSATTYKNWKMYPMINA